MSQLLLELFSEEIPSRMQRRASEDLLRLVCDGLTSAGLEIGAGRCFATPRRLTICIEDVPKKSPEVREERKGPRVGAPQKALEGFMRGAGLSSIDEAEIVSDPKKGDFYVAVIEKPGRAASDIIAELIPEVIAGFPWPKSMKWGAGSLRWVRPLQSILCVLGGKVVPFEVHGIESSNETRGHRFMAPKSFKVKNFDDYNAKLRDAFVILESDERAQIIRDQATEICTAKKLKVVEDEGLFQESAGLVEWPVVLMGDFDKAFLDVPPEVLTISMKSHQKCFSVKKGSKLSNHFLLVSNLVAADGGKAIIDGNERVIRARLSDAKFFWEQDLAIKLDERLPKLEDITFHEKLGTQSERVERIKLLAAKLAPLVGADVKDTVRAAALCKADLVTEMVGEFPDLQGLMGRYYAKAQDESDAVAAAVEDHYKPQGPSDDVPSEPVSIAVALADKLDTLVGFWAINEKPTGSKDPYALRRAALGVIRLILDNSVRLKLTDVSGEALGGHKVDGAAEELSADLLSFFVDRLKVYLKDKGARHDLIDAVFSLGGQDDLLMVVKRVDALSSFLKTDDGENLLAGVKRAQNILKIEEKKDKTRYTGDVKGKLLSDDAEKALAKAICEVSRETSKAIDEENFEGAMGALAKLRASVDSFFDSVIVNADDADVRKNRLNLLAQIREATSKVADFSKIEG